ncbi:unnamed protein product [Bathycoccus prasinos]
MPYLDNTFDYLVCNQVLEHVSKPWLCMDEFHRVLKKGGHAIVVVPSIYQEHRWPKDNWRLLKDGMEVLLGAFSHSTVGSFGIFLLNKKDKDKAYLVLPIYPASIPPQPPAISRARRPRLINEIYELPH